MDEHFHLVDDYSHIERGLSSIDTALSPIVNELRSCLMFYSLIIIYIFALQYEDK